MKTPGRLLSVFFALLALAGFSCWVFQPTKNTSHASAKTQAPAAPSTIIIPRQTAAASSVAPVRNESDRVTFLKGDPGTEPAWAVKHGKEWWRTPASAKPSQGIAAAPFNVGDVIDRARNEVGTDKGAPLTTRADTYSAEFDGDGVRVRPFAPTEKGLKPNSTELALRTQSIKVGNETLYSADTQAPSEWSVTGNVAQTELAPGLVEHFETRNEGTAITWVLNEKPAAAGDLTVFMAADGMHVLTKTDSGIHFADASGKARVRVGNVTVVDSAGKRTPAQMIPSGNGIAVTVPAALLASASYPIAIDPVVSAEIAVDEPVVNEAPANQQSPVISWINNIGWLVVWEDYRNLIGSTDPDIYGVKLNTSGEIQKSLILCNAAGEQSNPQVSSNGTEWLVAWTDDRNIGTSGLDIYGVTVSSSGQISEELPLSTAAIYQSTFNLASNGSAWLVVWPGLGTQIHGAIITHEEGVEDLTIGDDFLVSAAAVNPNSMQISGNGADWLVVWMDSRNSSVDLYGVIVSGSGTAGTELPLCTAINDQVSPRLASNGEDWFVVWQDERNLATSGTDLFGREVSGAGVLGDEQALCGTANNSQTAPAIASNGNGWFVVWTDPRTMGATADIYGTFVSSSGSSTGEFLITAATGDQRNPVVASDGSQWIVAWENGSTGSKDIYGASVTFGGTVGPATPLCTAPNNQTTPSISSGNGSCFVIWNDLRNEETTGFDVYGSLVYSNGSENLGVANQVSLSAANNPFQGTPQVSSNGTDWLVVWEDHRNYETNSYDIYGVKVTAEGVAGSSLPLCTATRQQRSPQVCSNGTDWFVIWDDYRSPSSYPLYGARVTAAGTADTEILLCASNMESPRLASNGTDWLVVWCDYRNFETADIDIYGTTVSSAGTAGTNFPICDAEGQQAGPQVAASGSNWLVVWEDSRTSDTTDIDIHGARVTAEGDVGADLELRVAENQQSAPRVSGNGTDWLVVWEDHLNDEITDTDIYGVQVGASGIAGASFPISTALSDQYAPNLAAHGSDWFVAWESDSTLHGVKVSAAGVIGSDLLLASSSSTVPQVTSFASGWVVGWLSSQGTNKAAWIDISGALLTDATGFNITSDVSQTNGITSMASLSASGDTFLAVNTSLSNQARGFVPGAIVANKITIAPEIVFTPIPDKTFSAVSFTVSAHATDSNAAVTFTWVSGPATVSGNRVTMTGVGTVTLRASLSGYTPVDEVFSIAPVITFTAIPTKNFSRTPFTLAASSISNATITFTKISGPVTISGNKATMTGLGSVTIRASQTGATPVDRTFVIKDTTKPVIKPAKTKIATTASILKITAALTDNYSAKYVQYRIKNPGKAFTAWTKKTLTGTTSTKTWTQNFATKTKGKYTLEVRAIDFSNNIGSTVQITITRQ